MLAAARATAFLIGVTPASANTSQPRQGEPLVQEVPLLLSQKDVRVLRRTASERAICIAATISLALDVRRLPLVIPVNSGAAMAIITDSTTTVTASSISVKPRAARTGVLEDK